MVKLINSSKLSIASDVLIVKTTDETTEGLFVFYNRSNIHMGYRYSDARFPMKVENQMYCTLRSL